MIDCIDREKWNRRYHASDSDVDLLTPAQVLLDYHHLLPSSGEALDLACGLGANALYLAQRGLSVTAWDISDVAIARLQQAARDQLGDKHDLIKTKTKDVLRHPPAARCYDVIVVSRFLERTLFPILIDALKPGGVLFYQTFIKDKQSEVGPGNPAYLLGENELLTLCRGLHILAYREEGGCATLRNTEKEGLDTSRQVYRNEAMIVAQRRL